MRARAVIIINDARGPGGRGRSRVSMQVPWQAQSELFKKF